MVLFINVVWGIIFCFRDDRCFSCQKFTLWLTFLQVKQVDLSRLTSLALDLATLSLQITFSPWKGRLVVQVYSFVWFIQFQNEPSCSMLNLLKFVYVSLGERTPNVWAVFQIRSNNGAVQGPKLNSFIKNNQIYFIMQVVIPSIVCYKLILHSILILYTFFF